MYSVLRPLLFRIEPEKAHALALRVLHQLYRWGLPGQYDSPSYLAKSLLGLRFPNVVGLAAGLDKNGDYIDELATLGFGFLEVGTVTPRPQPGNEKPRLFRLPEAKAIINRMGFNNKGVDYLLARVRAAHYKGVLGINIGKNADTPIENAKDDYLYSLERVYLYASYVVVNISSPNTAGLRNLQHGEFFDDLLRHLMLAKQHLADQHHRVVPLLVKVSPDLTPQEMDALASSLFEHRVEGLIATNTTLSREGVEGAEHADEQGGLSGLPVRQKTLQTIAHFRKVLGPRFPIIGVGGIDSPESAQEMLAAGADLVQLYTGLIYQGPGLVKKILNRFVERQESLLAKGGLR